MGSYHSFNPAGVREKIRNHFVKMRFEEGKDFYLSSIKPAPMNLKIVNLVFFGLMIVMNYLANALPLNDKTTGELSAQYPNLFVPAGITFSIWGIIYLLLLVFVVIQFRQGNREVIEAIGWAFALSSLLNGLWIVAWHYEKLSLSLLIMLGILASLVLIGTKIQHLPPGFIKAAFGIYLGWICIATIANVTAVLVAVNWGGWSISQQTWTIIMIAAGLLITAATLVRLNNPFMGLAVIWAFAGIVIRQTGHHPAIVTAAYLAIGIMAVITLWKFIPQGSESPKG